ncbi:MAG: hypothetical protein JNK63_10255 [Chthonomonas sp.]|nr:hypothetical protein [Chthonomonas sp.]
MRYQVAVAQFAPKKAELEANLARIAEIVLQAEKEGAELVVFAEAATSGYFLEGGVLECSLSSQDLASRLHQHLGPLMRPMDIVVGFYENDQGTLYNSAAYLEASPNGVKVIQIYHKFFLPTYGVFDEERFVSSGTDLAVFDTRLGRVALLICEDIWHSVLPTICAIRGAQVLIVPSATPSRGFASETPGNIERYERLLKGIAEEHSLYCVHAALNGFEGGKGFVGMGSVVNSQGEMIARSPMMEDHLLLATIDLNTVAVSRSNSPLLTDLQQRWKSIVHLADQS